MSSTLPLSPTPNPRTRFVCQLLKRLLVWSIDSPSLFTPFSLLPHSSMLTRFKWGYHFWGNMGKRSNLNLHFPTHPFQLIFLAVRNRIHSSLFTAPRGRKGKKGKESDLHHMHVRNSVSLISYKERKLVLKNQFSFHV